MWYSCLEISFICLDSTKSIVESYESVANNIETLNGVRHNIDKFHHQWFQSAQELAASIGINPSMPRITAYMRHRSNIPGDDEETYFRRNITIPCINEVCLCEGLLFSLIYKHYN